MDQKTINKVFAVLADKMPNPTTELEYNNDFTLLVAVMLSAQTTDVNVNKATKELFVQIFSPEAMLALGEEGLKTFIRSIGLFNSKAKNIIKMSKILIERYNSQVPSHFEDLTSLPGVGSKTAKVVLNILFKQAVIAVDTHVFRVSQRLGLTDKSTVKGVDDELDKVIPNKWKLSAHHWLILHGRYTCKARHPLCERCSISQYCDFYSKKL